MERCNISANTLVGLACRLIPGDREESCYLWQEVQGEPNETRKLLEPLVKRHPECLFQKETLEAIK